jgi:hypothetical protein
MPFKVVTNCERGCSSETIHFEGGFTAPQLIKRRVSQATRIMLPPPLLKIFYPGKKDFYRGDNGYINYPDEAFKFL